MLIQRNLSVWLGPQVNKFEQVQLVAKVSCEQTDTNDWKHYFPTTSSVDGKISTH